MTSKRRGISFSWCKSTIFPVKTTIYFSTCRMNALPGIETGQDIFLPLLTGFQKE
jgi:hypothetical protein